MERLKWGMGPRPSGAGDDGSTGDPCQDGEEVDADEEVTADCEGEGCVAGLDPAGVVLDAGVHGI